MEPNSILHAHERESSSLRFPPMIQEARPSDVILGLATSLAVYRQYLYNSVVRIRRQKQSSNQTNQSKSQRLLRMPRGAEFVDGPPASDNAIEAGENKIAGAPQDGQVCLYDNLDAM